ncbi:MAG: response regulator, partial [Hyphomicrobiaceae bacterium]
QLQSKAQKKEVRHLPDVTGSGRVLLVEDEDGVRSFAVRALRSRGFEVLEACNGAEALEVLAAHDNKVDIVVSDVVMPEMDGPTLLKELRQRSPDQKFVFMSGYPNDAFRAGLDQEERFGFLPKPFSLTQLVIKVKEELAG